MEDIYAVIEGYRTDVAYLPPNPEDVPTDVQIFRYGSFILIQGRPGPISGIKKTYDYISDLVAHNNLRVYSTSALHSYMLTPVEHKYKPYLLQTWLLKKVLEAEYVVLKGPVSGTFSNDYIVYDTDHDAPKECRDQENLIKILQTISRETFSGVLSPRDYFYPVQKDSESLFDYGTPVFEFGGIAKTYLQFQDKRSYIKMHRELHGQTPNPDEYWASYSI